jgi:hypothetical protein
LVRCRRGLIFVPYRFVYFVTQHPYIAGRVNAEPNLISVDAHNGNGDIITDGQALAWTAA